MNLTRDQLINLLEGKLPDAEGARVVADLRALPESASFGLNAQGNISVTGDGNAIGDHNNIFVFKGEIQADLARVLREAFEQRQPPPPRDRISIARLPRLLTPHLFGRDDELALLDKAWDDPHTNIVTFVAWGGVGKSALVSHWLRRLKKENYRDAERVYAWSFYSQGTSDKSATAEYFIKDALRWFGGQALADRFATASSWEKGEELARLVLQTRTLLILDGLEPVQDSTGLLKEESLRALLKQLAADQSGLCVISTRVPVKNLIGYSTVKHLPLNDLAPQVGAQLLFQLRVKGSPDELEAAVCEYGGHPLALTLLGNYLNDVYAGEVRHRHEIESLEDDVQEGEHAGKVLRAYEKWLSERQELAMLDVLRLLGLFYRPADAASVVALRAAPAIPGLTEAIQNLSDRVWRQTIAKLRRINLLLEERSGEPDTLDSHTLVRDHFRQQLKREQPEAWREGNNRLYEHLKTIAREFPETIEEMLPLYLAVVHGCEAGRAEEALEDVYLRRIARREKFFSTGRLGAVDADLAALRGFFESPWKQPLSSLNEAGRARVLHEAGYDLRAMGRLAEAAEPLQKSLDIYVSLGDWESATINAGQLNQLFLTRGDFGKALEYAISCEEYANLGSLKPWYAKQRATYAKTIHQLGRRDEAAAIFQESEEIYKRSEPHPHLIYQWGFMYCSLLLDLGMYEKVQERAKYSLDLLDVENQAQLLEIALDHLSLGRAFLMQAQLKGTRDFTKCANHLNQAVSQLQQSGRQDHMPRGLLARAELHRVQGDYSQALDDLGKAMSIAERGEMRLHLADYYLESARLALATGDREKAREHWATAKAMIAEMGYRRRDGEVAEIARQLGVPSDEPDAN